MKDILPAKHAWMKEDSKLVLLGGIMINVDGDNNDMFAPQTFKAYSKDG
jgi:hypothetical protein